ncbi:hypothetical protein SAMN04488056_10376 [Cohaesibacter marisflavi]|uniref:Uncharacterized protein n=1 Tax=Cohaesibacter marisflavi TaxID=655353 RepID=A0A1I5E8F3_9HYPH|nr:hypothetical protein [Cohaesibacter marisflavi]SFO07764.1 hypothetical protein SAMN04488056_10376 [Cohaesibacter marisflavi]
MPETPPDLDLAPHTAELSDAYRKGKASYHRASRQDAINQRAARFDRDTRDKALALLICLILIGGMFLYIQS